jgi:cytochrome c peroxidase
MPTPCSYLRTACVALSAVLGIVEVAAESSPAEEWTWSLPKGFPRPRVPADNPMSAAKVELGRHLFYDTRLSIIGEHTDPALLSWFSRQSTDDGVSLNWGEHGI